MNRFMLAICAGLFAAAALGQGAAPVMSRRPSLLNNRRAGPPRRIRRRRHLLPTRLRRR